MMFKESRTMSRRKKWQAWSRGSDADFTQLY